jgi:beta-N-acetylhexosaminidase
LRTSIGKIERAYSADISQVAANAVLAGEIAWDARLGLCLKHYPGIGGAEVDSHQEFMDISDALDPEQEALFYALAPQMFGDAVLVSHAIVKHWDKDNPITLSAAGIGRLRGHLPDTLIITDDMQMQGLQKALVTRDACLRSLQAGVDMLCIGNNLLNQEQQMADIADAIEQGLQDETLAHPAIRKSIDRVRQRKALLI